MNVDKLALHHFAYPLLPVFNQIDVDEYIMVMLYLNLQKGLKYNVKKRASPYCRSLSVIKYSRKQIPKRMAAKECFFCLIDLL